MMEASDEWMDGCIGMLHLFFGDTVIKIEGVMGKCYSKSIYDLFTRRI